MVGNICPKLRTKADVSASLVCSWARSIRRLGQGGFADALGVDAKTVRRAMGGETTPELHTALNSLLVDPAALDDVWHLYGLTPPRPIVAEAANDMVTVAGLSQTVTQFCSALADGRRDHCETLALADQIAAVLPALVRIQDEAAHLRGTAA